MRKKIIAGNWKMNLTSSEGLKLIEDVLGICKNINSDKKIIIFSPNYTLLKLAVEKTSGLNGFYISAQNCHHQNSGAFTGEISPLMLADIGVKYVILGHSERRQYFNETNTLIKEKVGISLKAGLLPIFCCGETLEDRKNASHFTVIKTQLEESLFQLSVHEIVKTIIAYEPVWAIGTGVNASPEQAQEIHQFIRNQVKARYGEKISEKQLILYGGSCKPDNSGILFACKDIDGGLIGGASLKSEDFIKIIHSC